MFMVFRDLICSYCPVHLFDIHISVHCHDFFSCVFVEVNARGEWVPSFLVVVAKARLEVVIVLVYASACLTVGGGARARVNRSIERTSMRDTIMQNDQKGSGSGETHSGSQD
jgi:hypothetical protein